MESSAWACVLLSTFWEMQIGCFLSKDDVAIGFAVGTVYYIKKIFSSYFFLTPKRHLTF